ncbi:ferri-bacillibactin esterase BesA [Lysinibacillus sp. PLM2]|nr:ferri-bacillibactin esterase BesA [Lysinibacillus sp. PLM2]
MNSQFINRGQVREKVALPRSEQYILFSKNEHRKYKIFVSWPAEAPSDSGYPVIYTLDANSVFSSFTESVRLQSRRPDLTGIAPAVVVGIGYDTEAPFDPSRHYDYTLPAQNDELPPYPGEGTWPKQGGAEQFLSFIENELKPQISNRFHIDQNRQILFGHSLGGLFVLNTLFSKPEAFQVYIAGSPSISWNERLLLEKEKTFFEKNTGNKLNIKLLIGVGELEKDHPSLVNEKAKSLFHRLQALSNQGVMTEYIEFADEAHITVLLPLINKAIKYSLTQKKEG